MNTTSAPYTLLQSLNESGNKYLAILEKMDDTEINKVPFKNSWTAAQVIRHITMANNSSVFLVPGKLNLSNDNLKIEGFKKDFLNFEIRMQSPEFLLPEFKQYSLRDCRFAVESCFSQLLSSISFADLREEVELPALGILTKWELAHFILYHTQRHLHQLTKIFEVLQDQKSYLKSGTNERGHTALQ